MIGNAHFAEIARWFVSTRSKRGEVIAAVASPTSISTAPMKPAVSDEYPYGCCRGVQCDFKMRGDTMETYQLLPG